MKQHLTLSLILLLLSPWPAQADLGQGLRQELRLLTEHLLHDEGGQLPAGGRVHQPGFIDSYYAESGYQPAWQDRDQVQRVLTLLGAAWEEGLSPDDYHYGTLRALWDEQGAVWEDRDRQRARFDVLLTDGLVLFIRHLLQGKVNPRQMDPSFNYQRLDFEPERVAANLRRAIEEKSIVDIVEASRPQQDFYQQMKAALSYYRQLDSSELFQPLAQEPLLKPGQRHANVIALRQRLNRLGYVTTEVSPADFYDPQTVAAVQQFQRDHGIDVDGVIGPQSYAFLNMTWAQRVDSLRINMDRLRWISQDSTRDAVIVNIAGFELYYLRDSKLVWETPVMTGTVQNQTPIFTARLKYLEFNPTWTVPRSIIGRSLLPKFKADPEYVVDNEYRLYDRSGVEVNPLELPWEKLSASNFPYSVVQQPWENNALGRVKFIFPNRYAVYLHDTPSRSLFSRSNRAFSAGCVRVKDPLEFAEVLLDDREKWSLQQLSDIVDSREPQRRIYLDREVDVMLMYWTTSPTRGGRLQFHADVYGKDPAALAALNAVPAGF